MEFIAIEAGDNVHLAIIYHVMGAYPLE